MIKKNYDVKIEEYEYEVNGQKLTAILALPTTGSNFPVVIIIHGHVIGNRENIEKFNPAMGRPYTAAIKKLTKQGYATFLPVMVGYGPTGGRMDFCGPKTVEGIVGGIEQILDTDGRINKTRRIIFGISRGATVAALLATKYPEKFVGAIFQSGVYDAKNSFEKTKIEGIRENFRKEAGTNERSFRERSPIFDMEKLQCPVLILHGEKDDRVDVSEAKNLDETLTKLGKPHKTIIFPEKDHYLTLADVGKDMMKFIEGSFK